MLREFSLLLFAATLGCSLSMPHLSASPSASPSAVSSDDAASSTVTEPTPWKRVSSGTFLDAYDNFRLAGFTPTEANRLAHIAAFGTEPTA